MREGARTELPGLQYASQNLRQVLQQLRFGPTLGTNTGQRVTAATRQLIGDTGGRGRWSDAIHLLARELDDDPTAAVVALDWGFHEPLLFLTRSVVLSEPIWTIPRLLQQGRPWVHRGDARHLYLVNDARYDLFGLGPKLLAAAREIDPERVEIRTHRDREEQPAFYTVRFLRPHQLIYTGDFEVRFR